MKKVNLIISSVAIMALYGCNSGSTSHTPTSGNTQYNLQNYELKVGAQTNNCKLEGKSTLNCDSKGTFAGVYSVTFNTPKGVPGAYVIMPPKGETYGLNIAATNDGCDQTAPESGVTYTCNFTIGANGTAKPNNTLYLEINGELGTAKIVTINIKD